MPLQAVKINQLPAVGTHSKTNDHFLLFCVLNFSFAKLVCPNCSRTMPIVMSIPRWKGEGECNNKRRAVSDGTLNMGHKHQRDQIWQNISLWPFLRIFKY